MWLRFQVSALMVPVVALLAAQPVIPTWPGAFRR